RGLLRPSAARSRAEKEPARCEEKFVITRILEALFAWITGIISAMGYGGIVLLMGIESACIPLPSEMIMPFAGYLVSTGRFSLFGIALAGAIGCVVGSIAGYYAGKYGRRRLGVRYGEYVLRKFAARGQ